MYGDPQSTPSPLRQAAGSPQSPGSNAWQASGQGGNTGSYGWFLSCNDASFPPLSAGITIEGWFNYSFYGSNLSADISSSIHVVNQQPLAALTLIELATSSNPVCILQLDTSGHLNLITYNGATPTSHSIYSTTDLRDQGWFSVTMELTTTTWAVYVNGSATASVSGTATGMTSAWTWLIVNGDLGTHGGSTAGTGLVHGANVAVSHIAVYPFFLPYYRIMAHYWAAVTACGLLPAPIVQVAWINTFLNSAGARLECRRQRQRPGRDRVRHFGGTNFNAYPWVALAAVVTANAPGSVTSGPSAYVNTAGYAPGATGGNAQGNFWVSWTGVAPTFQVYTSATTGAETEASVVVGSGENFENGYGASATGIGVGHLSGGSGASPPTAASAAGDTVAQRIERCLGYGNVTYPGRCIDPAPLLVQAGTRRRRAAAGQNVQNIATIRRRAAVHRQPRQPRLLGQNPPRRPVQQPRMGARTRHRLRADPLRPGNQVDLRPAANLERHRDPAIQPHRGEPAHHHPR